MSLSSDILLLSLARDTMEEQGLNPKEMSRQDFIHLVDNIFDKIAYPEPGKEDDELRSFFLGGCSAQMCHLASYSDQIYSAVVLRGQKLSIQWGDGDAQTAWWKLSLAEYHATKSASCPFESLNRLNLIIFLQYKYRICALRHIMAAAGVFGTKVKFDCRYNWAANCKGKSLFHSSPLFPGEPGHNIEGDLHLEHYQGRFKVATIIPPFCIPLPARRLHPGGDVHRHRPAEDLPVPGPAGRGAGQDVPHLRGQVRQSVH